MKQRVALAVALLSMFAAIAAFVVPVVNAGGCPAGPEGVLEKPTYAVGETLPFFGNYTDFADPGEVIITVTRPSDGLTRSYRAFNIADGSWLRDVVFVRRSDAGSWRVHVVVTQTSGTSICDDSFRLVVGPVPTPRPPHVTLPPTEEVAFGREPAAAVPPGAVVALTGLLLAVGSAALSVARRRR